MNLPEVPTLGLAIQGLCPGKDTALYHSPWKSVLDGSPDGKLKVNNKPLQGYLTRKQSVNGPQNL